VLAWGGGANTFSTAALYVGCAGTPVRTCHARRESTARSTTERLLGSRKSGPEISYIYTADDIDRIMRAAQQMPPKGFVAPLTLATLLGFWHQLACAFPRR
jgi:hypothetical protein